MDITWNMPGEDMAGRGKIVNISNSGVLLELDNSYKPLDHSVLAIDADIQDEKPPFMSKKGKVVWYRKIQHPKYSYICGVEFLKDFAFDRDLNNWIDQKTEELSKATNTNILNNYVV
jgi:hypothetical protein